MVQLLGTVCIASISHYLRNTTELLWWVPCIYAIEAKDYTCNKIKSSTVYHYITACELFALIFLNWNSVVLIQYQISNKWKVDYSQINMSIKIGKPYRRGGAMQNHQQKKPFLLKDSIQVFFKFQLLIISCKFTIEKIKCHNC